MIVLVVKDFNHVRGFFFPVPSYATTVVSLDTHSAVILEVIKDYNLVACVSFHPL